MDAIPFIWLLLPFGAFLQQVSPWKAHRREILHCVDWLLGRLRTEDVWDLDVFLEKCWMQVNGLELSETAAKVCPKRSKLQK